MSSGGYDWQAPDLKSANDFAIKKMVEYIKQSGDAVMTAAAQRYIIDQLQKEGSPFHTFYEKIKDGTVQIDVEFEGTINKGTQLFRAGHEWKVRFTIDADTPPPGSDQKKHIGYEIHIKGKSKQAGHAWCDAVPKGRPGTGVGMLEEKTRPIEHQFPNTDELKYWFTTYKIN
ncbi:unnamed protein product [Rotaria sp. Silwood1]|nr:unnamed protein product [Rotaria sp. Silwood1]CAF1612579.1 unnamed protein product [Rotaria sp. Silwood1]CAF3792541.1 unnamed protein product [Rotaria sp. Silwood1]CAF4994295.1 unnamed protein product [Rotaria sp. Silwood1]